MSDHSCHGDPASDPRVATSSAVRTPRASPTSPPAIALVHQDAHHRNLIARAGTAGRPEIVAIDWAWTGVAAVGADAAPLAFGDVVWGNGVSVDDLPALDAHVFDGYLGGLRDAGWRGDARLARLGYAAPGRQEERTPGDVVRCGVAR
jgi:hypothetical protein